MIHCLLCVFDHPEPIQSRCAVLRYSKLSDSQLLARLLAICEQESVSYTDDGLEAIIFTAQGDMRQVGQGHDLTWSGDDDLIRFPRVEIGTIYLEITDCQFFSVTFSF